MWGRLLVVILVVFGVWYYLNQKKAPPPPAGSDTETAAEGAQSDCFLFADRANSNLATASAMLGRLPVDQGEWARVEAETKTSISAAESTCLASGNAMQALGMMRTSLSELSSASRGEGGATGVAARQGEIDSLLNRARGR
ncbi:MAG TPA: hypothetical protein VL084_02740 [Thermoanaerobaculia bacterium]|nr:hypothetical protein [Thermoanaerobaculia bacterium]